MKLPGTYDYASLDASGEASSAVFRMEARASAPASRALFEALVRPLLTPEPHRILEVGAGTGALARKIAEATSTSRILVTDKSHAMIAAARKFAEGSAGQERCVFAPWDVGAETPSEVSGTFELALSSVMVPYLSEAEIARLISTLASRLAPGGVLAFVEQDLQSNALNAASASDVRNLFVRRGPQSAAYLPLRLRRLLREEGLELLPRRSFLWTSERLCPYLRDLLGRAADEAAAEGRLDRDRGQTLLGELEALEEAGDFYYGLVYHLVAASKPA